MHTRDLEPQKTPDGKKFLFVSNRPTEGTENEEDNLDIWVMDRVEDGWSNPSKVEAPIMAFIASALIMWVFPH